MGRPDLGHRELERIPFQPLMLAIRPPILRAGLLIGAVLSAVTLHPPVKATAQLPVAQLHALSRSSFAPGTQSELQLHGQNLDEVDRLLFSDDGITAEVLLGEKRPFTQQRVPSHGRFKISIADDVPEGIYEVWAVGRFGVSNPCSVLISDRVESVLDVGHRPEDATPVRAGRIYCRTTTLRKVDFYRMTVDAGQTVSLRLIADLVDSELIGMITVVGKDGRVQLSSMGATWTDAVRRCNSIIDYTTLISVQDALFRGGKAFTYGLVCQDSDDSSAFSRMQVQRLPASVTLPDTIFDDRHPQQGDHPLVVPAIVEGNFSPDHQQRFHECDLLKGVPVEVQVYSDRLGEPTDVRLRIDRKESNRWQSVAKADDSQQITDNVLNLATRDPTVLFTPTESGTYRISLADQDTGTSIKESQRYLLSLQPVKPRWNLLAYQVHQGKDPKSVQPCGSHLLRGGNTVIRVFAVRNGFSGPIRLLAKGQPEGVHVQPSLIAKDQASADLIVTVDPDQVTPGLFDLSIQGEVTIGEATQTQDAKTLTIVKAQSAQRQVVQLRRTSRIPFYVSDHDHAPCIVRFNQAEYEVQKGKSIQVPVQIDRTDAVKNAVILRARQLPAGIRAKDLTIAADKTQGEWNLTVSGNIKPGTYRFWGQAESKIKFARNPQAARRLKDELQRLTNLKMEEADELKSAEIQKEIDLVGQRIADEKKSSAPKDLTVHLPTTPVTLIVR